MPRLQGNSGIMPTLPQWEMEPWVEAWVLNAVEGGSGWRSLGVPSLEILLTLLIGRGLLYQRDVASAYQETRQGVVPQRRSLSSRLASWPLCPEAGHDSFREWTCIFWFGRKWLPGQRNWGHWLTNTNGQGWGCLREKWAGVPTELVADSGGTWDRRAWGDRKGGNWCWVHPPLLHSLVFLHCFSSLAFSVQLDDHSKTMW